MSPSPKAPETAQHLPTMMELAGMLVASAFILGLLLGIFALYEFITDNRKPKGK